MLGWRWSLQHAIQTAAAAAAGDLDEQARQIKRQSREKTPDMKPYC